MTSYLIPRDHDFSFPDYESIFSRLTSAVGSVLSHWTNYIRASFENVLLGNQCFNFDVLMGYLEQRIKETRLATVVHRAASVRMARMHHNYRPDEAQAATAGIVLSIDAAVAGTVTFAAGTVIFTAGSNVVSGQLTEQKQIAPGGTEVAGTWEHSETVSDSFDGNGKPGQRIPLSRAPYIWESAAVTGWTEVEHLADYGASDQVYKVEVDQNGFADLVFGDGTYGAVPSGATAYSYDIGGGLDGNVATGSLTRVSGSFQDDLGNPVTVSCTNAERATGGGEQESVELIKLKAPAFGAAQQRSVGKPDMETNAELVSAIARVLVLTVDERAGIAQNTGHVYAVGYGANTNSERYRPLAATSTNKSDIETNLNTTYPVPATFNVITQDTAFYDVDFSMTIGVDTGFVFADVAQDIYDALDDFFAVALSDAAGKGPNTSIGFFQDMTNNKIQWHVLFNVVIDIGGLADVDEDTFTPTGDVTGEKYEWPRLGSVTITDSSTGSVQAF